MMTWTNGLILGLGGLLVAAPVILHLLMQPKPKEMLFPALRFLKERQHARRSRLRLRHWLLLFLRCLLIALVALAMAGPAVAAGDFGNWLTLGGIGLTALIVLMVLMATLIQKNKNGLLIGALTALLVACVGFGGWSAYRLLGSESDLVLGNGAAPVAALILIDTSPRMQYRSENQTRLDVAREMGKWLIRQFPLDSQVCVAATDNDQPFFSVDVAAASRRVETLETNFIETSIPNKLASGWKLLESASQERKEIYIVTDLTRQSWIGDDVKPVARQLAAQPETSLFVIDVGVEQPVNFALSTLELSQSEIAVGGHLSIRTQINRNGDADQRTVRMSVESPDPTRPVVRDGKTLFPTETLFEQTSTVNVRENGSAEALFRFSQSVPTGTYHGQIAIEGKDGLAIDNQRHFTFRVRPAWDILVVHPPSVSPRNLTSTIAPSLQQETGATTYNTKVILQEELIGYENLVEFDGVYLLDPDPLPADQWQKLSDYVRQGGGLAICLGANAADGSLADPSFHDDFAIDLLTGRIENQWFAPDGDVFFSPQDLSHPLFKSFRSLETGLLWNRFPVYLHWGIDPVADESNYPTQTLLRFSDREPALIERQIGNGRVLVLTTPVTERAREPDRHVWNELFIGKFLPAWMLVRAMTAYLVQDDAGSLNVTVGQLARLNNSLQQFPEVYQMFSPKPDRPPTPVNSVEGQIRYRFTDVPGHYRLKGIIDQTLLLRGFSVNLPESATDLTRIELDELDRVLGPERYQLARQKSEIERQQGTARTGQEFYPLLMMMSIVVLAVEYLMSNRFYRS